jgi:hypothetical protein
VNYQAVVGGKREIGEIAVIGSKAFLKVDEPFEQ